MAVFLYRVGRWAFRRRRLVSALWLATLVLAGIWAALAPSAADDGLALPGTESQKAFDLLAERFPESNAQSADARLVFKAPDGQLVTAPSYRQAVEGALGDLSRGGQVASVTDPYAAGSVSSSGTIAYATITYTEDATDLTDATTAALENAANRIRDVGLTTEIGGSALESDESLGGASELIGLAVAVAVLVLTFGSLVAAGLPLLTAILGVTISFCLITALAVPLGVTSTATILAIMLGMAVGIDYALFIVSRYRAERAEGRDPQDAAGRAAGTAGSAVVFAGLTVTIALVGLSVVGVPELTKMGLAASGAVALAVCVALTLVPALLGFLGHRVLPRDARTAHARHGGRHGLGARWVRFVLRRPVAVLVVAVLGLGVMAAPALSLELGLPGDESKPTSSTERRAYDLLSEGFGPGFNGPLTVVVDTRDAAAPRVIDQVSDMVTRMDGVVSVGDPAVNQAKDTAILSVIPKTGPSSGETRDVVHAIRHGVSDLETKSNAQVLVTGTMALNIDISQAMSNALIPYLAIVVGLAVLLLMVVFRSILVPIKAALGFLLSVGAALGVVVAVFQWGWAADLFGVEQTGPVMSLMPILMIGVVFGLAMDYEVFLVTRMREAHVAGDPPGEAIVNGFQHSGRVVAAAAFIMISVFGGFVGAHVAVIKTMGVGLAAAVAFDVSIHGWWVE
ncbi:Membrane protein YdfJ [Frankia canadensis]|uniref:Membrane protein YdfJ n=1 Tax=Frankia canadensis TaxID=1836972 RepID=A0A2I2KT30_9ACTN|nr:MMPL family transporter [Frankia canadensis]SNQ48828.1 Membrane protein YdfJ [Frankia canadensis]SOU56118.1 Membrane protein YdfJ [Frankia canadensis]